MSHENQIINIKNLNGISTKTAQATAQSVPGIPGSTSGVTGLLLPITVKATDWATYIAAHTLPDGTTVNWRDPNGFDKIREWSLRVIFV